MGKENTSEKAEGISIKVNFDEDILKRYVHSILDDCVNRMFDRSAELEHKGVMLRTFFGELPVITKINENLWKAEVEIVETNDDSPAFNFVVHAKNYDDLIERWNNLDNLNTLYSQLRVLKDSFYYDRKDNTIKIGERF